jgi:hypothetical protein
MPGIEEQPFLVVDQNKAVEIAVKMGGRVERVAASVDS